MKSYSYYLFDLDGTLITTIDLICECFAFSLKKFLGVNLPRKDILVKIGLPLKKQFNTFIIDQGRSVEDFDLDEMASVHMDFQMTIWRDHVKPYSDAKKVLAALKERSKGVAIVTSRLSKTATLYLEHTGLMPYCDAIITPESTERHKPDPQPVQAAMKELEQKLQLSAKPSDTLMVGDSLFDLQSGIGAGVDVAWALYPDNPIVQIISEDKSRTTKNHPNFQLYQKLAHYTINDLKTLLNK